jgi:hemolysin activation/secretion protein
MNLFCRAPLLVFFVLSLSVTAPAADAPRFDVNRYQVEGNSILPASEVEQTLAPFTGKGCDFATLQQAVEALELRYRDRGYHAVKVLLPEQELQGGVVRLTVLEVRIGTVIVEGNKHFDSANIRRSVPQLKEGTVPNLDRISMNIRVANENPARKTQMMLQSGDSKETTNAQLKVVDEKPWKVGVSLDDTGNEQTGNLRLGLLAQHANLFNLDHLLTLQYTTSPDHIDKVSIYNFGYRIPLYNWGDSIDIYGGYSDVDSGSVQSGVLSLNVSGKGTFAGVRYNQNLVRHGSYEHRLMYGFDYRRFENSVDYAGIPLGTTTEAMPLSVGYSGSYALGAGGETEIWGSLSQNIPGGDKGDTAAYHKLRVDAPADFRIFRAGGTLRLFLPGDFQTRLSVNGQYTNVPLIPGEQFGAGGQNSLRGFDERELSNDVGFATTFECYSPDFMKLSGISTAQLRALLFYDTAYLERNKPQPGEEESQGAASTGLGLRLAVARNLVASTDYAFVLDPAGKRSKGDGRWHFKVQLTF